MISADKSYIADPIIDMGILRREFPQYYSYLGVDELQPRKIILCSNLIIKKDDALEKIIFIYRDRLVILKYINGNISKYTLEYSDIDYVVKEGVPEPYCITIEYKSELKERIFYDRIAYATVDSLLYELRSSLADHVSSGVENSQAEFAFSDLEENKYPGAAIAKAAVIDRSSVICSLKQKRVYDRLGLIFRKTVTYTHFTVVCKKELLIFFEKSSSRHEHTVSGDLIHISINALKNISIEATGTGMLLKYQFNSGRKMQLFYENERTDQLLKIMSYINGLIQK